MVSLAVAMAVGVVVRGKGRAVENAPPRCQGVAGLATAQATPQEAARKELRKAASVAKPPRRARGSGGRR